VNKEMDPWSHTVLQPTVSSARLLEKMVKG